jgi:hypothetical protein
MRQPNNPSSKEALERAKATLAALQKEYGNKDKSIPPPTPEELEEMFQRDYRTLRFKQR